MSLYTKYRPRDWDSVVGQDTITTILRTSLATGKVAHAYIFTGSRGTGKTTSARILAKGVNCTDLKNGNPCHQCENCRAFDTGSMMDVIEIDAASNSGVENVRQLIENAKFSPTQWAYKVYIIDEVHMLSGSAFNALLKTIEEPPEQVKFILATTEIHEVPETIRSRTLRFDFKKITESDILKRLEYVVTQEGIEAEEKALHIIARAARWWLRDALTLLEQNTLNNTLSTRHVESMLSLIDDAVIDAIIDALRDEDIDALKRLINILNDQFLDARGCLDQILYSLRDRMIASVQDTHFARYRTLFYGFRDAYTSVRIVSDGMLLLEMTFWSLIWPLSSEHLPTNNTDSSQRSSKTPIRDWADASSQKEDIASSQALETQSESGAPSTSASAPAPVSTDFSYRALLWALKTEGVILAALKTASFHVGDNSLRLILSSKWHHEKLSTPQAIATITSTIDRLFGLQWQVQVELWNPESTAMLDEIFS